jgi:hypothetical protein
VISLVMSSFASKVRLSFESSLNLGEKKLENRQKLNDFIKFFTICREIFTLFRKNSFAGSTDVSCIVLSCVGNVLIMAHFLSAELSDATFL